MSDSVVYHFTDSLHLPWIVKSGELRPNLNRLRGIGDVNYLWGTTNPDGDKTARALIVQKILSSKGDEWEEEDGDMAVIRFTLPAAGFVPWRDIKRKSTWTKLQIAELEAYDRSEFGEWGQAKWRCRRKPLPIKSALKVEVWGNGWMPIKLSRKHLIELPEKVDSSIIGITINEFAYYSKSYPVSGEIEGRHYSATFCRPPEREELVEFLDELQEHDEWAQS